MVLNKTKTIKERVVYVYLPSEQMVKRWKTSAKKEKNSLSKFVIEHVENGMQSGEDDFTSRLELIKKVEKLEEENSSLHQEKQRLGIVIDKLQEDLQIYRMQPFISDTFVGIRSYEKDLVDVFRKKGFIKTDDLWREIDVNPCDVTAVKSVTRQLDTLEKYGLIKKTFEGWRWKG